MHSFEIKYPDFRKKQTQPTPKNQPVQHIPVYDNKPAQFLRGRNKSLAQF